MAGETTVTIIGNLTAAPNLQYTQSGAAVLSFTVASTPRIFDKQSGEWKDGEALFLRCNVWRQMAEHCAESLDRGSRVLVTGRLQQRSYETKDGEKRTAIELQVDEIGPSLRYATAKINKATRGDSNTGGFGGGQQQQQQQQQRQRPQQNDDPWGSPPPAATGGFLDEPPF